MSDTKVSVEVVVEQDGEIECAVSCNGQRAKVVFTGTDVYIRVPQSPQDSA